MSCSHCERSAELRCSCGEHLCSEAHASHFRKGHSAVPVQVYDSFYAREEEVLVAPQNCSVCGEEPCAILCTCAFPWSFFCRKCAEKHVINAESARHGLEPLAALRFLRKKSDKRAYIERQMLLDDISECLRSNVGDVERARTEFLAQFQSLVASLEAWKEQCVKQLDDLEVQQDVQWALERVESQRFSEKCDAECGLDSVLRCSQLAEAAPLLCGVRFELVADSLLQSLPTCFRVESRLKSLRLPPHEFAAFLASPAPVPLQELHSSDVQEQLISLTDSLVATQRLLSPSASVARGSVSGSADMEFREEVALAVRLARDVLSSFDAAFQAIRTNLNAILTEMGAEMQVAALSNSDFPAFLAQFRETAVEAVANMSSVSHALRTMESVERLEKEKSDVYAESQQWRAAAQQLAAEKDRLLKEAQESLPLHQENDSLREKNKRLSEDLEKLRLSLSLGLGESVKGILESAKVRVQCAEKAAVTALESSENSVLSWTADLSAGLARERTVLAERWAAFSDTSSLESACDYLRQADEQVTESAQAAFCAVRDAISHNFQKLQLELEGAWDKAAKESLALLEDFRRALELGEELPSFGMFKDTLETELIETKEALGLGAAAIQRHVEELLTVHNSIVPVLDGFQRKAIKKKDRPAALARLHALLTQVLDRTTQIREAKDMLQASLNTSLIVFEEASKDSNFRRVSECKEALSKKSQGVAQASRDLSRTFEKLKSSQLTSASTYLSLSNSHYESLPSSLQAHRTASASLIDTVFSPLVSAILQTQRQCESQLDSIAAIVASEQQRFVHELSLKKRKLNNDFKGYSKPFPDDISVKPVILSETMTSLINANEGLHEELGLLTQGLADATRTSHEQEVRGRAETVEKLVQTRMMAVLAHWMGRATQERKPHEVDTRGKLPDISFPLTDTSPVAEPAEVQTVLLSESAFERKSMLLKQLLPERFSAVPLSSRELWSTLDSRISAISATFTGDFLSTDLLISEMDKAEAERFIASLSLLASYGQPKAILFLRIFGLEADARTVPKDLTLVVKYMKLFRTIAEQYARNSVCQWKNAEMYQRSRGGEAWLDDVLTKFAHQFTGEIWTAFLKYLKPPSVPSLQFLLFLVNWRLSTQTLRKEAPPLWPDSSTSVLRVSDLCSYLQSNLEGWLPAGVVETVASELCPEGYIDRATAEACISRTAYLGMAKDERFVVRGDMFLLGILEAHFATQRINARKMAETFEGACIREGKVTKVAFAAAVRMIAKDEDGGALFEEAAKLPGAGNLEGFLRVMARHKLALFVHQLQVY